MEMKGMSQDSTLCNQLECQISELKETKKYYLKKYEEMKSALAELSWKFENVQQSHKKCSPKEVAQATYY